MENEKSEKERKKILIVIGAMILIGVITIIVALKYKPKNSQVLNVNGQLGEQKGEDDNYSKLREIFKKDEAVLTDLVNEFEGIGLMKQEKDLHIYLDKKCDGRYKPIGSQQGANTISQDLFQRIQEDATIDSCFSTLEREYNGKQFYYDAKDQIVRIYIDAEETPFITDNDKMGTMFIYRKGKGLESKGYHKIKDDWYMWIVPKAE